MNSDRLPQHPPIVSDPFYPTGEGSSGSSLRRELGVLFRSKELIGITLVVSLLLATAYNYGTRPLYEATAVLSLQSSPDSPFIPRTAQDQTRLGQAIDLQVRRLKSRDLALAAIRSLEPGLSEDLAKGELGDSRDRLLTEVLHKVGLMKPIGRTTADQVRIFRSRLKVQYTTSERVVYVRFTAYDRESAIGAVRRLLNVYIEETRKDAEGALGQRQEALAETVAERQGEVVESLDRLQDIGSKEGLQNAETRMAMLERELVRLQESLIAARASRQQKRALLEETRKLATADVVTLPMFRDDREVAEALVRIAELESAVARAAATLGERHPDLVALRADAEEARRRLSLRVITLRAAVEREYELAQREENDIVGSIDAAQRNLARLGRSAVEQSFIRKEADAGQKVVGELIERSVREREAQILFLPAIVQRPEAPPDPVSPQRARNFQYAIGIGLALGIGLAWLRAHLDETVKTPEDIEGNFDTPYLGMVPRAAAGTFATSDLFVPEKIPSSQMIEAYRVLRTNLTLTDRSAGPRPLILVTSAREGEGKTTTSCGLATSLALDGHRVLLIDCDLRRAALSRVLKAKDRPGLTDALSGRPLDRCIIGTPVKGLDLLPSGTPHPNPAEVLGRTAMVDLLESLRTSYDWILCDAPPALAVADAAILGRVADSVIVVVGANLTPVGAIRATLKQIRAVHASVRGIVLNSVDLKKDAHYFKYYYAGHYADYSSQKGAGRSGSPARKS